MSLKQTKMKKTTTEYTENYSEHLGSRLTPSQMTRLKKWAKRFNLSPALFLRQLLLNHLDELEASDKKK